MKTTILTLVFIISCTSVIAQIPQSTWMALGGICFDNDKSTNYGYYALEDEFIELQSSNSEFALKAGAGFAFAEDQVIGLKLGHQINRSTVEQLVSGTDEIETRISTDTRLTVTPFYRYYYFCAPAFAFIGQLRVPIAVTGGNFEVEGGPNPSSTEQPGGFGIGAWLNPKFAWFPKDNWSLEAGIGRLGFYTEGYDDSNNNRIKDSQFSAKLWLFQPRLTFSYYFGRAEKLPLN